jgi:aspartate/glutamate racemase
MDNKSGCVGFVHTTPATIGMAEKFMKQYLPFSQYIHKYDGRVKIDNFLSPVGVTPKKNLLRWAFFADQMEQAGCNVIVSCCSLMPRATAFAQKVVSIPFTQLDAVILDMVAQKYSHIGVINTTAYVIPYVEEGLSTRAKKIGKDIRMTFSKNNTALELFNAGEFEKHNKIVIGDIRALANKGVDCVFMGQIPFALMDEELQNLDVGVPIHFAGFDAFQKVKSLLDE